MEDYVDYIYLAIFYLLLVMPLWRIFRRAGFNPALSLLVVIPGVGHLIVTAILGFCRWPNIVQSS